MKKIKYYYNTHTLRFEKLEVPLRVRLLQVFAFVTACVVTGLLIVFIVFKYIDSPKEKFLRQENEDMKQRYSILSDRLNELEMQMDELENRDNNVYREIFGANPIPDSVRTKVVEKKNEVKLVARMGETELVNSMTDQLNQMALRQKAQEKSYVEITNMVKNKEKLINAEGSMLVWILRLLLEHLFMPRPMERLETLVFTQEDMATAW